jgi:hypothetical protein
MKPLKPLKIAAFILSSAAVLLVAGYSLIYSVAKMRSAAAMADSASKFLASLNAEQKTKANYTFDGAERQEWYFVPRNTRKGLPLKEMNEQQRKLAMDFLKAGLSAAGYQKATNIISLEPILKELEGPNRTWPRDHELYHVSIYGTPGARDRWGWSFEGHHLSLNFTVVKGELVSISPAFMGTNPAEVRQGERKGLRVLADEEDKGRALISALDDKQKAIAIFDAKAPSDILTVNKLKIDPLKPDGISYGQLNKQQKDLFNQVLEVYLGRMLDDVAAERRAKLKAAGLDKISFAWAGGMNRGDLHYYRLQGPTFLVEYDNTQNNGNHVHSVWRDFNGDFGADLLREHYKASPHDSVKKGE